MQPALRVAITVRLGVPGGMVAIEVIAGATKILGERARPPRRRSPAARKAGGVDQRVDRILCRRPDQHLHYDLR